MLEVMPSNQCSSHSVDGFCQDVTVCVCVTGNHQWKFGSLVWFWFHISCLDVS